jgi:hypothetical protein
LCPCGIFERGFKWPTRREVTESNLQKTHVLFAHTNIAIMAGAKGELIDRIVEILVREKGEARSREGARAGTSLIYRKKEDKRRTLWTEKRK